MKRIIFRDPKPLPPGAPPFVDDAAAEFYAAEKRESERKMAEYDRAAKRVRQVDWVVGNLRVARRLVETGHHTPEAAEPVVRRMLAERPR